MKSLPLLLGSLVASITFGGAFAQMYGKEVIIRLRHMGHRLIHRARKGDR
jgi:hypothetical protein